MVPQIFVSSTIADLAHVREALRDTISELAYFPVLSENGGVGYSPSRSAEDSCYAEMGHCQLAALIVGKRYGSIGQNGISITHNEFRTARRRQIPVFILVEAEVLSYRKVYEASIRRRGKINYPAMDNPDATFGFLREIIESSVNNGILAFSTVAEARHAFKQQLAHFMGELLLERFNPMQAEIKDILAEVRSLRNSVQVSSEPLRRLRIVSRLLLEDRYNDLKEFLGLLFSDQPIMGFSPTIDPDGFDQVVLAIVEFPSLELIVNGRATRQLITQSTVLSPNEPAWFQLGLGAGSFAPLRLEKESGEVEWASGFYAIRMRDYAVLASENMIFHLQRSLTNLRREANL